MHDGQTHMHSPNQANTLLVIYALIRLSYERQLELMLNTPQNRGHEDFLMEGIRVSVGKHKLQPMIPQEGGEELANAWVEGNQPKWILPSKSPQ